MKIRYTHPDELSVKELEQINSVVAHAFRHSADSDHMLEDTKNHLAAAELLQLAEDKEGIAAMAMYRSCLWQPSY